MFVASITRWSIATALLLMMATLQAFLLLPTVQSLAAPSTVGQITPVTSPLPTTAQSVTLSTLPSTPKVPVTSHLPSTAKVGPSCRESMGENLTISAKSCVREFVAWILLVSKTGGSKEKQTCVNTSLAMFCMNKIACQACSPDLYAPYRDSLKLAVAKSCESWPEWIPRLECAPKASDDVAQCEATVAKNLDQVVKCSAEVAESIAKDNNIKDPTEELCKTTYGGEQCGVKVACEHCADGSASAFLNGEAKEWSPKEVECTKWSSEEPKMDCSATTKSPHSNTLMMVGIILAVIFLLVAIGVAVYCVYFTDKSGPSSSSKAGGGSSGGGGKQITSKPPSKVGSSVVGGQKSRPSSCFRSVKWPTAAHNVCTPIRSKQGDDSGA